MFIGPPERKESYVRHNPIFFGRHLDEEINIWKKHILPQRGIPTFTEALSSHFSKEKAQNEAKETAEKETREKVIQEMIDPFVATWKLGQNTQKYIVAQIDTSSGDPIIKGFNTFEDGKELEQEIGNLTDTSPIYLYLQNISEGKYFDMKNPLSEPEQKKYQNALLRTLKHGVTPFNLAKKKNNNKIVLINTDKGKGKQFILQNIIPYFKQNENDFNLYWG